MLIQNSFLPHLSTEKVYANLVENERGIFWLAHVLHVDLFNPRNQVELTPGLGFKHGAALCSYLEPEKGLVIQ
jgi:hypothetical protein